MAALRALILALALATASADMYLNNMRGSNNRLDERNRDRNNANRIFDSQNNNRGGYNVGNLYHFEGEKIPLEWTLQHGCGNDYNDCEVVMQYMCDDRLRDGVTTRTIPQTPAQCANKDCNNDIRYGMHEDYDYYMNCRYRRRNQGLFTADRNLNGNTARFTRQNNNGQRRGYECPEERDHYPYWHPSPWVDIAVLTNDVRRCKYYQAESENVKGRFHCRLPDTWYHHMVARGGNNNPFIPNTDIECNALNQPNTAMSQFLRADYAKKVAPFEDDAKAEFQLCVAAQAKCTEEPNSAQCILDFNNTNAIFPKDLTECPVGYAKHATLTCACIPAACVPAYTARNMTMGAADDGCAVGEKVDTLDSTFCVSDVCFEKIADLDQILEVEKLRAGEVKGKNLLDETTFQCVERESVGLECASLFLGKAVFEQKAAHNANIPQLEAPQCLETSWSRPNQHGNTFGGFMQGFNWTFPAHVHEHCAFRVRYNITTRDYLGIDVFDSSKINAAHNSNPRRPGNPTKINIGLYHDIPPMSYKETYKNYRGYHLRQNPDVYIFDFYPVLHDCPPAYTPKDEWGTYCKETANPTKEVPAAAKRCPDTHNTLQCTWTNPNTPTNCQCVDEVGTGPAGATRPQLTAFDTDENNNAAVNHDFKLQLAINTAQFGRTFQDRTHKYSGRARTDEINDKCNNIYALNGRGKRGNIVQVYPAVEYDFTPNRLIVAEGDCIHFQWTGSNTNPNNNDGQGKRGTDRHNIAMLERVRGEGGRGVNEYGGKGRDGRTWTTKSMEPGWDGFNPLEQSETMMDLACPPPGSPHHKNVHPSDHKKCFRDCSISPTLTTDVTTDIRCDAPCRWTPKPATGGCPANTEVDSINGKMCITIGCSDSVPRESQWVLADGTARTWQSGFDYVSDVGGIFPSSQVGTPLPEVRGAWGGSHPEHLDNVTVWGFAGLTYGQLVHLSVLDNVQFGGELSELDDAGTYFDMPLHVASGIGTYNYMCTRNNNFSNRSQKGQIRVEAAPSAVRGVGMMGGVVGLKTRTGFTESVTNEMINWEQSQYAIRIPAGAMDRKFDIETKIRLSPTAEASSDILEVQPVDLASNKQFNPVQLTVAGSRRRAVQIQENVWFQIRTMDAQTIWWKLTGSEKGNDENTFGLRSLLKLATPPKIDVIFKNFGSSVNNVIDAQGEVVGIWKVDAATMVAIESGALVVEIKVQGSPDDTFVGGMAPVPGTGQPFQMKMPVSPTMSQGKLYFYPLTPTNAACLETGLADCTGSARVEIPAVFSDGQVEFQTSGSITQSSAGYYQVSAGNNLPIIVGVTCLCVVLVLAAVGSAVYFRKHPDKWDSVKLWGPNKYKSLKRSFASHV